MDDNESEEMDGNECEEMDDNGYEDSDSDEEECMEANGDSVDAPSSNEFGEEYSDSIAPTETFEKLLTPDTVAHILTETNRYGEQYTDEHADYLAAHPRARAHDFLRQKFSLAEMYR